MKLRTMGFNVRCANDPNGHSVEERAPRVMNIIEEQDPDIICLQEVTPIWIKPLHQLDEKYDHVIFFRDTDFQEGAPVFWKKDRLDYVSCEQFWFNDTPDRPHIKGWGADHVRHCIRVTLKDKQSGKLIHAHSCHFCYVPSAQPKSAELMIKKVKALGEGEIALCIADYNFVPNSEPDQIMKTFFREVRQEIAPDSITGTCCGYNPPIQNINSIIDHCFYSGAGIDATGYEVITKDFDGKYASDHYGMVYDFNIE